MEPIFFADQFKFRDWLEQNFNRESEILVGFYKVNSGMQNMTWSESVDQALCFGWIDGIRKSIDKDSYCIRFTPRRPNSKWSTVNINKMESLIKAGLMRPAGLECYKNRKEEHSSTYSYENKPVKLPADFENQFKENKLAWEFYKKQAPSYKKNIVRWVMDAKQESTRKRRLEKAIIESEAGRRLF